MSFLEFSEQITPLTTFCEIHMAQVWRDLALWEWFLNNYPSRSLIEIGSLHGGMSLFLALQCRSRGMRFATIDYQPEISEATRRLLQDIGATIVTADVFARPGIRLLTETMKKPLILFCDGGNKPREFIEFEQLLDLEDRIVIHDFGTEFDPKLLNGAGWIKQLLIEECKLVKSRTAFCQIVIKR